MRILRINGTYVDIDDQTAVGLDLQSYDVKDVGKPKINVSNTFTVPATTGNLAIFGDPGDTQSTSDLVYQAAICDYWIDNEKVIDQAKVRVEEIEERISLFIFEKKDFWQDIRNTLWPDFVSELVGWLQDTKGLPSASSPFTGTPADFLTPYFNSTEGVFLPLYLGNLGSFIDPGQKHIEKVLVTGAATGNGNVFPLITSGVIPASPFQVTVPIANLDSASTVATKMAAGLNANSDFSSAYEAYSLGAEVYAASKESLFDPTFSMPFGSTTPGIPANPTSVQVQLGLDAETDFLERFSEQAIAGIGGQIYTKSANDEYYAIGGHFCVYEKTIFEFIEFKYNVNLLTSGGVLPGNVWDDPIALKLHVPIRTIDINMASGNCYFQVDNDPNFLPYEKQLALADKTVHDYVTSFMAHLDILKDELYVGGEKIIRFARFDDLENTAEVVDFSGNTTGVPKYKPRLEGYAQNNYIKFKEVYPEGDSLINSKNLTSDNVNLDVKADLVEIDEYISSLVAISGGFIADLSPKESFKTFSRFISDTTTTLPIAVTYSVFLNNSLTFYSRVETMQISELYSLTGEYNFLAQAIDKPVWYELKKWLTIEDIKNFEFFKQYYIRELNGSFFINKIKGFNPDKSKDPTTLELMKISNKAPIAPSDLSFWVDGVSNVFTDGEGDYFY